jgi:hypothetical protein
MKQGEERIILKNALGSPLYSNIEYFVVSRSVQNVYDKKKRNIFSLLFDLIVSLMCGRAVARRLVTGFPPRRPGFAYGQHVGFVVDEAALGQVFSEYFGFPCQSFHRFLHYHNHPGLTQ